jgi:hypothetical protein
MSSILKGLQLNELSNKKLGDYKTAAGADATAADKAGDYKRGDKRMSGIIKATKKEFANDKKKKVAEAGMPFRGVGGAFNRGDDERHDLDPTEWYIVKDGKMYKTSVYPNQVQLAIAQGYSRSREEATARATRQGMAEDLDENLNKWFKEKWVRFGPDGKIRGDCARGDDSEGKPKCLPQSKAHSLGKKGRASAAARKRREDPNPERSGKAINVNTKKKSNEDVAEGYQFKGPFPFDVDHMHGGRGINLPKAETKKYFTDKKQWEQAVNDINSSKYDDNSDYIGVTGRSTVEINGREWARWSDAQQKGYIELSSMSEQGVAEGNYDRDDYYNARQGKEYGRDLTATGYGGDGSKTRRDDIFKGQSKRLPADPFSRTSGAVPTAGTGRIHSTAQPDEMDEGDISQLEKDVADAPVAPIANMEGAKEKIGGRHDPADFDDMINRLKKLAGAGPMKTVYDPNTRRYKNMPTAVQPRDKK